MKHTPDAAKQIDAAPDAPAHGPVSVTVYDPNNAGTALVGIPVVFIEANGTVVGRPLTDSSGVATADVHSNATATAVIVVAGSTTTMMTVAGVQPNDHILLGPSTSSTQTTDGMFTVSWSAYTGATSYNVVGPCGNFNTGTATSYAMTVYTNCKQSAMDILVVASNSSGPIAYLEKPNVTYTAGGSAFISGTFLLPSTFNATYTNVDASITNVTLNRVTPASIGFATFNSGAPANGTLALSALALNAQTSTVTTRANKGGNFSMVEQNMAGNATTYTADFTTELLPWVGPGATDFANNKVMIPVDTTGTSTDKPDVFFSAFAYSRTNGSAGTSTFRWYVFGPQAGDVTIPPLPPEVGDVLPQATDTAGGVSAFMLDSSDWTWDMVRMAPFDYINQFFNSKIDTTTRIRESSYQLRG